jgi:hypothetical protein
MTTFATAAALTAPLLQQGVPDTVTAAAAVRAVYEALNATWAASGDGSSALTNASQLAEIYALAFTYAQEGMQPGAQPEATRRLLQAQATASDFQALFDGAASVSAGGLVCSGHSHRLLDPLPAVWGRCTFHPRPPKPTHTHPPHARPRS